MARHSEVLDRVEALEEEVRMLKQALSPKARLALAIARTRRRAKDATLREIACAADCAVPGVRRSASKRSP